MNQRRIAVFTGNRAEYGLLYPLLKHFKDHPSVDFHLIVSGAHLDEQFGNTIDAIKNDGFTVSSEVKIGIPMNELSSTSRAIGSGVLSASEALEKIHPDMVVVYADRFEGFAATIASSQMCIPTAHIEGGDITEGGALDDSVRHAMTKLAHLHFTTNQEAANRVLAMGEEPWRVYNVGFPGIDLIKEARVTSKEELAKRYNIDLTKPIVVFTQHPVATEFKYTEAYLEESLKALWRHASKGVQIIFTYPNNDAGCQIIIHKLDEWDRKYPNKNIQLVKSLGQENYYGFLELARDGKHRVACGGNSSSGIKETPAFGCPSINIGTRQSGRLRAENVLDATYNEEDIYLKIQKALYDDVFREICRKVNNPYGVGGACERIVNILVNEPLTERLLNKKMTLKGLIKDGWFS